MSKQTPSQTVGPFYAIGLTRQSMNVLASDATQGERIRIEGQVFDGDGVAIPDAMDAITTRTTSRKNRSTRPLRDGAGPAPTRNVSTASKLSNPGRFQVVTRQSKHRM